MYSFSPYLAQYLSCTTSTRDEFPFRLASLAVQRAEGSDSQLSAPSRPLDGFYTVEAETRAASTTFSVFFVSLDNKQTDWKRHGDTTPTATTL